MYEERQIARCDILSMLRLAICLLYIIRLVIATLLVCNRYAFGL